jgi:SMI1-KNR4 cell-wall
MKGMMSLRTIEGGPALTEQDVASFERKHGLMLPQAYRSFLLRTNGGRPERDLFPVPGFESNPVGRVHVFFGIGDPVESCNLEWNLEVYADRIPAGLLPIATTEGPDKICLATSGDAPGAILYWDGYQGSNAQGRLYLLAESFEQFLGKLYRDNHSPRITQ